MSCLDSIRQWLLNWLQAPPEDGLSGYPFGIVIDGYCNYATERTVLYGPDMQVMGIRWTDPTGDLNEAFGCSFRIIHNKDFVGCAEKDHQAAGPDVV